MRKPAERTVWQRRALALAERFPASRLHPAALSRGGAGCPQPASARSKPGSRTTTKTWAVAFSGGPDSLALLLLLWAHWPARRPSLLALHFDHALRGAASRADARFCAAVCRGLGIRFASERWRRPASVAPSEAAARDARLDFFGRLCARRRVQALWLGHQQDDVAETMFMRLARGSGTAGLAAPRPVTEVKPVRLRPLLTLQKRELCAGLKRLGIPYRKDATNGGDDFLRNRVRRRVIPAWITASGNRDALAGAALSRALLQEDDDALEQMTDLRRALTRTGRLDLRRLSGAPTAVWRRALHRWVIEQKARKHVFTLSRAGFELLLAGIQKAQPTRISMGARTFAEIAGHQLILKPR